MVIVVGIDRYEKLLNDIERMASGSYEVMFVTPNGGMRFELVVTIRLEIEEELVFNEEEIKRKLGF